MYNSYRNIRKKAVSSNGKAAVMVIDFHGELLPGSYAPSSIGDHENREEYNKLFSLAAAKLGYKRDKRCLKGWRNITQLNQETSKEGKL